MTKEEARKEREPDLKRVEAEEAAVQERRRNELLDNMATDKKDKGE